ncbi:MAG: hypothetical protein KGL35_23865 [Bradyrhizobium sp.]|nr:hypothetical protein [Pseudomonadota bacterium]MDE2069506.1 hypothetical protein [Bradyrhizobium sp.]MDE2471679.1 hypothetical protein [Bradyrhizobium sp.]
MNDAGDLVGIVSRSNIIQASASGAPPTRDNCFQMR